MTPKHLSQLLNPEQLVKGRSKYSDFLQVQNLVSIVTSPEVFLNKKAVDTTMIVINAFITNAFVTVLVVLVSMILLYMMRKEESVWVLQGTKISNFGNSQFVILFTSG